MLLSLATQACSLGMFGSGIDQGVKNTPSYRKINPACAQVDLSKPELDPKSFRELLGCLNANQGLEALHQLVARLTDAQLQSLIAVVNRNILRNPGRLYQLEKTHAMLAEDGSLDESLLHLGKLIENEEFIASSIALLKDGYFVPDQSENNDAKQSPEQKKTFASDRIVLKALQRLSTKITPRNSARALDALLSLASSKAFPELLQKFGKQQVSTQPLREITDQLLAYLQSKDPGHPALAQELLGALVNQDLFAVQDQLLGASPEALRSRIPRTTSVLKVLLAGDARMMNGLTSLIHYARAPIPCLSGGASVEDPIQFMIRELLDHKSDPATFLQKDNVLTLTWMNSFCAYPPELGQNYSALLELAETSAIHPMVELLSALNAVKHGNRSPLLDLVLQLLGDTGTENSTGIKRLLPLLSEFTDRGVWDSLLLTATLLKPEARDSVSDLLQFMLEPAPELDGKSAFEIFSTLLTRTSPDHFFKFISSMRQFADSREPFLAPGLHVVRRGFHSNNVHPLTELIQTILAEAPMNESAFSTLFEISEMPEFSDTLRLFSEMSKDGRMKDLLSTIFTLFHKFAATGSSAVEKTSPPPFTPEIRHDYSTSDLVDFEDIPPVTEIGSGCRKLDFNIPLSDTQNPGFGSQLGNLLSCINSDHQHDEYVKAIEFLNEAKTEHGNSYFTQLVDLIAGARLTGTHNSVLVRNFIQAFDDGATASGGKIFRLIEALPFWLGEKGENAVEPLLKLARPIIAQARPELERLEAFAANDILRHKDFTQLLGYFRRLQNSTSPAQPPADASEAYDLQALETEIRKNECDGPTDAQSLARRAREVIYDFENASNNWELVNGRTRDSWNIQTVKDRLDPILQKMADPAQSAPDHTLKDALLKFLGYFSLQPGASPSRDSHFSRDALFNFFKDRSNDYQPISYIYEPDGKPRVRLVNSMDRLELVLINADIVVPAFRKNYGLQFTAEIGEAWGDEPFEVWPREIQEKFPKNSRKKPKTLRQAVDHINKTFRFFLWLTRDPELPDCRQANWRSKNDPTRHFWGEDGIDRMKDSMENWGFLKSFVDLKKTRTALFNVNQVIDVLYENLPEKRSDGTRILRNLFFELYYSSPKQFRSSKALTQNNLRVAIDLVKMGIGRQPGRLLRELAPEQSPTTNGPAQLTREFFISLTEAANAPGTPAVLDLLIREPGRVLTWEALSEIFELIDSSTPEQLQTIKQSAFYALIAGHQLGIADVLMNSAQAVLSEHQEYLGQNTAKMNSLVRSTAVRDFLKNFAEDQNLENKNLFALWSQSFLNQPQVAVDGISILQAIDSDPQARAGWNEFLTRRDQILASPDYQKLNLTEALAPVFDFFQEKSSDPDSTATARRLRLYLADQLEQGTLDQLFVLAASNPAEFYQVLKIPSRAVENGELQDFLRMVRRTLGN
ncbi:MAG TPA: hypothetical protein DIS93_15735 [Bdellovibrionales bacterium]|nr:hypothetical protein [Bdellovibrionales bacterium]